MPCYYPLHGYRAQTVNKTGKRSIVFDRSQGLVDMPVDVPCGRCIGCRLERSRQWAMRCVHEASLHADNCFVTLTFSEDTIVSSGSLVKADFQNFMKRLRKKVFKGFEYVKAGDVFLYPKGGKVRYFHCGEYGSQLSRPHHHACLFGFDFPDKVVWSVRDGVALYRSKMLEELWPFGFCTLGNVTFESAAYVARYVTKKITGDEAGDHYQGRQPEYISMSLKPGIGQGWIEKFKDNVYPDDFVVVKGVRCKPPRFYDKKLELSDSKVHGKVCRRRKERAKNDPDNSPDRLAVREQVKQGKFSQLKRSYENET